MQGWLTPERSRPPQMTRSLQSATPGSDWEAYVRRAAPVSGDGDSDAEQEPLPLAPTDLPAPGTLPDRDLHRFFSPYHLCTQGGTIVKVPRWMVMRDHTATTRRPLPEYMRHHLPHAGDVIVLMARDAYGDEQYGWYVRWQRNPRCLTRVSYSTAESLWAAIRKDPTLKQSSLNEVYIDSYFSNTRLDFDALATLRLESLRNRHTRLLLGNKKRPREEDSHGLPRSKPASPDRAAHLGQCTVCLEEDLEVHATRCCGAAAATCAGCRLKLRNICPLCERKKLNAAYQCLTCNAVVALKEYGMPCASCNKCTLCTSCFQDMGECVDCDVVRGPRV